MKTIYKLLSGVIILVLLNSCQSNVVIKSVKPAKIHLGGNPEISIIDIDGNRRNTQDMVIETLVGKARKIEFFKITDKKEEGIKFRIESGSPVSTGKIIQVGDKERFIDIKIIEADVDNDLEKRERSVKVKGSDGKTKTEKESYMQKVIRSEVVIAFSVFSSNRVFMNEKEYIGKSKKDVNNESIDKDLMTQFAIEDCIAKFLMDITPVHQTYSAQLDDSDDGQGNIISDITNGRYDVAKTNLLDYSKTHENIPSVWYNLAVITDAQGDYDEAIKLYKKAISMGGKDYYDKTLSMCMLRKKEYDEMK
jgi:hypothetical protein